MLNELNEFIRDHWKMPNWINIWQFFRNKILHGRWENELVLFLSNWPLNFLCMSNVRLLALIMINWSGSPFPESIVWMFACLHVPRVSGWIGTQSKKGLANWNICFIISLIVSKNEWNLFMKMSFKMCKCYKISEIRFCCCCLFTWYWNIQISAWTD